MDPFISPGQQNVKNFVGEKRDSRIVFIGRNLPGKMITAGFESCIAK